MMMPSDVPPKIHGAGHSEAEWRLSAWLKALPTRVAEDLFHAGRLLVVSPHPDDEVLGCGGLIYSALRAGLPLQVISVTQGEACYPGDPRWPPSRLRRVRSRELVAALEKLGASSNVLLELLLPDGAVVEHETFLADRLNGLLRAGDRVLTTWRQDGHPDHEATARAVRRAATQCDAEVTEFPIWAWHWMGAAQTECPLGDAYKLLLDEQAWVAKQSAIECFVSQCEASPEGAREPILPARVLARFQRSYEVFIA